jgi:hypothetical protein
MVHNQGNSCHVILSEAKNLHEDAVFLRDSSVPSLRSGLRMTQAKVLKMNHSASF